MRHLLAFIVSLAAIAATPAFASRLVDVTVVDRDSGRVMPTYVHRGQTYIAGTPGHRYAIRLTNRTGQRVMTVLSVDGVNAVSGETAAVSQNGYVLGPWQSTDVRGWRKSLDEIAQFEFTALPDSYAARTGRPANVGVIGVAVFTERMPVIAYRDEAELASRAAPPPVGAAESKAAEPLASAADSNVDALREAAPATAQRVRPMAKVERLGTGHGAREGSRVTLTNFERANRPAQQVAIRYDSHRKLVAMGIIKPRQIAYHEPDPFPAGFVADPLRR